MKLLKHHQWVDNNKGQSYSEYSIIITLISLACIGVFTVFGQYIRIDVANLGFELAGNSSRGTPAGSGGPPGPDSFGQTVEHQFSGTQGQIRNGLGASSDNSPSNGQEDGVVAYLGDSILQVAIGQYADNPTMLGTGLELVLSFTGLDIHLDIINITHDIHHWENTPGHVLNLAFDVVGIVPVIGGFVKTFKKVRIFGVCFVAETQLLMEDGSTKAIAEIDIGEHVISDDPKDGDPDKVHEANVIDITATIPSG